MTEPRDLQPGDHVWVILAQDGERREFDAWVLYRKDGPHVNTCGGPYSHPIVELNWYEDRGYSVPILRYGSAAHESEDVPDGCRFPIRYRYREEAS